MDTIRRNLDSTLKNEKSITKEEMREIIDAVVYAEVRVAQKRKAEEKSRKKEEAKRMTLNKYIDLYIEQAFNGARQTDQGRTYDFKDIDMTFYYDYTAYLKNMNYAINSVGKCVKELKAIFDTAEIEGLHNNSVWEDKKFKGTRVDIDSIYLTREDLDMILAADLSKFGIGHEQVRDIFMVGVWTVQRVSDYDNIQKENFDTLTKNVMREEDDPEHPVEKKVWIEKPIPVLAVLHLRLPTNLQRSCSSTGSQNTDLIRWELLEGCRRGDVLTPRGETVIARYEQVVTGNPVHNH